MKKEVEFQYEGKTVILAVEKKNGATTGKVRGYKTKKGIEEIPFNKQFEICRAYLMSIP